MNQLPGDNNLIRGVKMKYKRNYSAIMTSASFPFDEPFKLVRSCKKVGQVGSVALWGSQHEAHINGGWEQAGPLLQDGIAQGWCLVE
jgi:hypothetical protein